MALHRTRQASAERIRRKLQWAPARRTPERDVVLVPQPCREVLAEWQDDYNIVRPHSAIGKSFHRLPTPSSTRATCNGTDRMS
ncbi:integrase core domain-containing protein [Novosphingobium resinovorum]|uniref:integrase core domain-containing protein n=1 Tax=Novosphingobium resinovorum TaxID=158500 RepID=UPI003B8A7C94